MKTILLASLFSLSVILIDASIAKAQVVTLPVNVEHYGALFDATRPITFSRSGKFERGTLKSDYSRDGRVYELGTEIVFFEDGSVSSGQLKAAVEIDELPVTKGPISFHPNGRVRTARMRAGSRLLNLAFELDTDVTLDTNGRAVIANVNMNPKYRLLGVSLRSDVKLIFDDKLQKYFLQQGTVAESQLVARLVTERDTSGMPTKAIPVVLPPLSSFQNFTVNPTYALGQQTNDRWFYEGNFVINNLNFGTRPWLLVRDMRLLGVQINQALNIGGIQFQINDVVLFNELGKVLPRGTVPAFAPQTQ